MTLKNAFGNIALDASVQKISTIIESGVAVKDNLRGTATLDSTSRSSLQYAAILTGGSGYAVGDEITLAGGTSSTSAKVKVTAVASGVITGVKVSRIGRYSATTGTVTQASTTGSGTGAQFTATWATNVLEMLDTTGYSYFQFQFFGSWGYAGTSIEGSVDGGITWNNHQWYFGSYGSFSPAMGESGSAVNLDIHYCPAPAPMIRIKSTNNNSIAWALRSVPVQTNIVRQGSNSGTNQFWYTKGQVTVFGAAGNSGGGGVVAKIISAATTNALLITSSGYKTAFSIVLGNKGTTIAWLKIYNKGSTPTVGTDTPVAVYPIPAGGSLNMVMDTVGYSFNCSNGWAIAITGEAADNDTTAIAAGQVAGTIILN